MTSKSLFWNKNSFSRRVSKTRPTVIAAAWISSLLYNVVGVMLLISIRKNMLTNTASLASSARSATLREMLAGNVSDFLGITGYGNLLIPLFFGFIVALQIFSYLNRRQSVDFYHSLPITKKRLFTTLYLTGIRDFLLPWCVTLLLGALTAAVMGAMTSEALLSILLGMFASLIIFAEVYGVTVFAMMLSGNGFLSVCLSILFQGTLAIPLAIVELLRGVFCATYYGDVSSFSLMGRLAPLGLYVTRLYRATKVYVTSSLSLGQFGIVCLPLGLLLIIAVVIPFASYMLFRIRREDDVNTPVLFAPFRTGLKLFVAIIVGILSGVAIVSCYSTVYEKSAAVLAFFIMAIVVILVCMIAEAIYGRDVRRAKTKLYQAAISFTAVCLIFYAFRADVFGYDTYVPKADAVESFEFETDSFSNNGQNETPDGETFLDPMVISDKDAVDAMLSLAKESGEFTKGINRIGNDAPHFTMFVTFHLQNGKSVKRDYDVPYETAAKYMDAILATDAFLSANYAFPTAEELSRYDDAEHGVSTMFSNGLIDNEPIDRETFLAFEDAYQKDLNGFSYTMASKTVPIAEVDLFFGGSEYTKDMPYSWFEQHYEIYPSYKNSIRVLNERLGYAVDMRDMAASVSSVAVYRTMDIDDFEYSMPDLSEYDYTLEWINSTTDSDVTLPEPIFTSTDGAEIQQVLNALVPRNIRTPWYEPLATDDETFYNIYDETYFVRVDFGDDEVVGMYFLRGAVPEFVEKSAM